MSKITEVINSLNDENVSEVREQLLAEATALNENNRQLYQRAKKAEGFEFNRETKEWIKKESKPDENKKPDSNKTNKGELDYGQKAFLAANGVKGADELTLVKDFMENTGKSLEEILENKHFLNEVKEIRDTKAVNDAVPGASKRGGGAARDSVEYWIAKGELPPANQPQLRRDYVNAKLKKSKEGNMFYNS